MFRGCMWKWTHGNSFMHCVCSMPPPSILMLCNDPLTHTYVYEAVRCTFTITCFFRTPYKNVCTFQLLLIDLMMFAYVPAFAPFFPLFVVFEKSIKRLWAQTWWHVSNSLILYVSLLFHVFFFLSDDGERTREAEEWVFGLHFLVKLLLMKISGYREQKGLFFFIGIRKSQKKKINNMQLNIIIKQTGFQKKKKKQTLNEIFFIITCMRKNIYKR